MRNSELICYAFAAGCLLMPLQKAAADSPGEPPALTSLRLQLSGQLAEAEAPLHARWLAALERLEKEKAAVGEWEAAEALRARRVRSALTEKTGARQGEPEALLLLPEAARGVTAVDFSGSVRKVGRFRRTGALMEWELPGQVPGLYEVTLTCGVGGEKDENDQPDPLDQPAQASPKKEPEPSASTAGGIVEFRKISNLTDGGATLRRTLRSTGGWSQSRKIQLGTVELDNKIVKFSLRAATAHPAGLMDFHQLELRPVNPAMSPRTPSDPAGLKELERLQEVYEKQFQEQTRTATIRYQRVLSDLEVAAVRGRDNDTLAMVRQEKERLQSGSTRTGSPAANVRVLPVTERLYVRLSGDVKVTSQGDYLTRMRPATGCEVNWKLAGLGVASGRYSVEVEARMVPGNGGKAILSATTPGGDPGPALQFAVKEPEFSEEEKAAKRKPDGSPAAYQLRTFKAGKIVIPKGSEYLSLRVTDLSHPDVGLMDLKSLRLTPLEEGNP